MRARALTVAGFDPSGGAGVAQDLRTFHAFGVWGMAAITAVTVQDTSAVHGWLTVPPEIVRAQIVAVRSDIGVDAVKTGMLPDVATIVVVAEALGGLPLVVDPVFVASSGGDLTNEDTVVAIRGSLLPKAVVVTPNCVEAEALTGIEVRSRKHQIEAAHALRALGAHAALVTGGHLDGTDVLVDSNGDVSEFSQPLIATNATHGTGCVLSAAITAALARGEKLTDAVAGAKRYVTRALEDAMRIGKGSGPVYPPREA